MSFGKSDQALRSTLSWAIERMKEAGYRIESPVRLVVDPSLSFMGYASQKDGVHYIVASDWALDSEMLGGFIIHELSHIYATEAGMPSHDHALLEDVIEEVREREDLNEREVGYLVDAFSHLQNIIVDDIVFELMSEKEVKMAQRFFASWVTPRPSGNPVLDASSLVRNAFAVASLKRRGLYQPGSEMDRANSGFLEAMGERARAKFEEIETFLEKAKADDDERTFKLELHHYLQLVLSAARERKEFEDLR
jgi:hypothetical protein